MPQSFLSLFCPAVTGDQLTRLVEWCDRYSPLAAIDGPDGLILNITGCTHLYGGEDALFLNLQRSLHRMGIQSRAAIADAWGIAWALSRYSQKCIVHGENAVSALAPLPVEALRIPPEIVAELRRLGLSTISAVRKIPRQSLAARFGSILLWRLDRIFHQAEELLTPWRPPTPYRASRILAEPVSTTNAVEYVLRDLLQEICEQLERSRLGSRHMELACYRVDGSVDRCVLRTSKPTRSLAHLLRLFQGRLDTLKSGFGFEILLLSVLDTEALDPAQLSLTQANPVEEEASFDALVDRLGMKFGFQEVNRICVRESFWPERAVEFCPASARAILNAEWPAYRVRPIRLIEPPMRIRVSILIPGESPVEFFIGSTRHRIVRSEGPERLTAEWWRDKSSCWATRDYYRIEDEQGSRFWIFREASEHWFLHGHLP